MTRLKRLLIRLGVVLFILGVLVLIGFVAGTRVERNRTIYELLSKNEELRAAIANLTAESQIAYAKVISQTTRDGRLFTRLRFVETARDDPAQSILEKDVELEGDVIHFDALIVRFGDEYVSDGRERALYLWRRVYSDKMAPETGFTIEAVGAEPKRYRDIFAKLPLEDREMFWTEIWKLSNDPLRLKQAGITTIEGKAIYRKVRPGLIYVFKISNTGNFHSEAVPAL